VALETAGDDRIPTFDRVILVGGESGRHRLPA
jgi:hypothetical protein